MKACLKRIIVNELLDYAHSKGITSFKGLKAEKYHELRQRYSKLPSHYIYTACQMACSIYKSFRKLKRKGKIKSDKPMFKKDVIMLDDHLFKLDLENWTVKISTPNGGAKFKLLYRKYHGKFRDWKIGQAWLVKRDDKIYLNVVFSKSVEIRDYREVIGVDVNENNVTTCLLYISNKLSSTSPLSLNLVVSLTISNRLLDTFYHLLLFI